VFALHALGHTFSIILLSGLWQSRIHRSNAPTQRVPVVPETDRCVLIHRGTLAGTSSVLLRNSSGVSPPAGGEPARGWLCSYRHQSPVPSGARSPYDWTSVASRSSSSTRGTPSMCQAARPILAMPSGCSGCMNTGCSEPVAHDVAG